MCQDIEINGDSICDLEFIIAKLVGDITEEQVSILTELKDDKNMKSEKEDN